MTESIQNCPRGTCAGRQPDRVEFLEHAAQLYGRPPATDPAGLAGHDDTAALLLAFPWLSDAELLEALWAIDAARHRPADQF